MRKHCHWQQETLQVFATDMNVKKTDSLVTRNITVLYCWLKLGWPLLPVTSVLIGTVSQATPAAMLQVVRWHMRTTLQT